MTTFPPSENFVTRASRHAARATFFPPSGNFVTRAPRHAARATFFPVRTGPGRNTTSAPD